MAHSDVQAAASACLRDSVCFFVLSPARRRLQAKETLGSAREDKVKDLRLRLLRMDG